MKLNELLNNVKVEWKKLGEVFDTRVGYTPSKRNKEYWENGCVDWFTIADIRDRGKNLDFANVKISKNAIRGKSFQKNSIILSIIATIGEYALIRTNFVVNQQFMVFTLNQKYKEKINMEFMNYFFYFVSLECQKYKRISNVPTTDTDKLLNFKIPIPPLEIQEKIVKILDKFTNYTTELQTELQLRTKQYEYYRNLLLSKEFLEKLCDKCNKKDKFYKILTLGEVVKLKNGKDWKTLNKGKVPVYGSGGKMDIYVDKFLYDKPTVLIPRKGSVENIFYIEVPFWNVDTIFYTEINNEKVLPKYFYYYMANYDLKSLSINPTRPSLNQSILNKIEIILPPLDIQNRVIRVLDKFSLLCKDVNGLLPKEINKRQKEYEYFREKLLTFKFNCGSKQASKHIIPISYLQILEEAEKILGIEKISRKELDELLDYEQPTKYIVTNTNYNNEFSIPVLTAGQTFILGYTNEKENIYKSSKENPVIIFDDFTTANKWVDFSFKVKSSAMKILKPIDKSINLRYCYFYMQTLNVDITEHKRMWISNYSKQKILYPPLKVQNEVVRILDKFSEISLNLEKGLPKEIDLRQKEYEFYRDLLLNFKKD